MSAMTPPSFLDDGVSITDRLPQGLDGQRIAKWVSRSSFSDTSFYTGSFFDDDEDMVVRGGSISDRRPGYEKREGGRKQGGERGWNENTKRAVSGDVRRHVVKIRDLRGKVQVKKVKGVEKEKVVVPVPRQWGPFVIKDKDGRVVVVDGEGEFDSGPQDIHDGGKQQERRWVRAASTVESASPFFVAASTVLPPLDHQMDGDWFTKQAEAAKREHTKDEWNMIQDFARPLTPIPESEDGNGSSATSGEFIRSSTGLTAAVTTWNDGSQASTTTGNSHRPSRSIDESRGWVSPSKLPHPFTWATSPFNGHERWIHGVKVTDDSEWTDSETSSLQKSAIDNTTRSLSEATWDGFERRKTLSDVSIAGSNSVRSSVLEIQQSSRHDSTAMSRRRGTSREEVRVDNEHGWEHGSTGTSNARYASSSDRRQRDVSKCCKLGARNPRPCG